MRYTDNGSRFSVSRTQEALAKLKTNIPPEVESAFTTWLADARLNQVRQNIIDETALATADFESLLNCFAAQLASGNPLIDSWQTACRAHKLKGRRILDANCPTILGRAISLEAHAISVAKASRGDLT